MGKKSEKADVDTMSKAELEKLLGKHGNRKFAPTPMNHYAAYAASGFFCVLCTLQIWSTDLFDVNLGENAAVTLLAVLVGTAGLVVCYDKAVADLKISLSPEYFKGKIDTDEEQATREQRLLREAVPRGVLYCNAVFVALFYFFGMKFWPHCKVGLSITDFMNFVMTTVICTWGQAAWLYGLID